VVVIEVVTVKVDMGIGIEVADMVEVDIEVVDMVEVVFDTVEVVFDIVDIKVAKYSFDYQVVDQMC